MQKCFIFGLSLLLVGCFNSGIVFDVCDGSGQEGGSCRASVNHAEGSIELLIEDSFERDYVLPNDSSQPSLWWRKVINDRGRVFDGLPGPNIDAAIFTDAEMGPAAHGERALYFYGREGHSIHNIYMVSSTFDLSEFSTVVIDFSYLPIDLESEDYLRIEVCNSSLNDCGLGHDVDVSKMESGAWALLFEESGTGTGLNGKNHIISDWQQKKIIISLQDYASHDFTFRINVRVDEGFKKNQVIGLMEDGVAIDAIRVRAIKDGVPEVFF